MALLQQQFMTGFDSSVAGLCEICFPQQSVFAFEFGSTDRQSFLFAVLDAISLLNCCKLATVPI
jgi:hypothetical protein